MKGSRGSAESAPEAEGCRIDVWLWRARLFKTRSAAGRFVESRAVRLLRRGVETRVDKPSRLLLPGDGLVFAVGGRVFALRMLAAGVGRGPPAEARRLYRPLQETEGPDLFGCGRLDAHQR